MASSDTADADAKRASTRGFGGYLLDRATGRADFRKDSTPAQGANASPLGVNKTRRQGVTDEAYAKGGSVKSKLTMKTFEQSKYDKDTPDAPEGSAKDMAKDRKQMAAENRKRGFASGGMVLNTDKTDAGGGPVKSRRGYGKARGA